MEITLEMVDQVRERTGCTYEEAKNALEGAKGNVVDAIIAIEKENSIDIDVNEKINGLVESIKAAVQKGNANRIRVMRNDEELANVPVNAGIAGGVLGVLAGPAVLISTAIVGAVAKFGFNCRFEIVKEDGTVLEIFESEETPAETAETEAVKETETPEQTEEVKETAEAEKTEDSKE